MCIVTTQQIAQQTHMVVCSVSKFKIKNSNFEFLTERERERERVEMNDEIETSRLIGLSKISKNQSTFDSL